MKSDRRAHLNLPVRTEPELTENRRSLQNSDPLSTDQYRFLFSGSGSSLQERRRLCAQREAYGEKRAVKALHPLPHTLHANVNPPSRARVSSLQP